MDSVKIKKGRIASVQMAMGEHEFKHEQLKKMFNVGDIREKAILSLGICLGFGATAFSELKREDLEKVISQRETETAPLGFWMIREKTNQPIRCHLTIEAMEALTAYWATLKETSEWAFPSNGTHISTDGLNYILKSLVEKANIATMGNVKFHLLRKFLFSALTNVMDEMNAKLCIGKAIDKSVLTYLKNKTQVLKQQYSEAEKFFVLGGYTNHEYTKMEELESKIQMQDERFDKFLDIMTQYMEEKLTKKQVVQQTQTIIQETYGRVLSDKEALEESLGKSLTDKEYEELVKSLPKKKQSNK